jgi:hypothetical protein
LTRSDYEMWTRRFLRKRDASTARRLMRSGAAFCRMQIGTSRRRAYGCPCRRYQSTGSHSAPPALISCKPSLRLPIPIIFFSAKALLVIALPTHLGAGGREAWRGCTTTLRYCSESHLDGRARDLEASISAGSMRGDLQRRAGWHTRAMRRLRPDMGPPLSARPQPAPSIYLEIARKATHPSLQAGSSNSTLKPYAFDFLNRRTVRTTRMPSPIQLLRRAREGRRRSQP